MHNISFTLAFVIRTVCRPLANLTLSSPETVFINYFFVSQSTGLSSTLTFFTDMSVTKMDREGEACERRVLARASQKEWKRNWRKSGSMGLTTWQLPFTVETLCKDTYHYNPTQQTPDLPFYRCGQEHRGVK